MRSPRVRRTNRESKRRSYSDRAIILCFVALCAAVFPTAIPTFAENKVLILNSDMSIRQYMVAQTVFKKKVAGVTSEIDLAASGLDGTRLGEIIAAEMPNLLYCVGSRAYLLAQEVAGEKPIVLSSAINWQRFPMGPRTYGIATEVSTGMQLMMFRFLFPDVNSIGVLYSEKFNNEWLKQAEPIARNMGIEIRSYAVGGFKSAKRGLRKLLPEVDALWLIPDPMVLPDPRSLDEIFHQADSLKKPIFTFDATLGKRGAALVISPDIPTVGRQAAGLAKEILADLTIDERFQAPAGSEITVNLKTIQKYGLKFNDEALNSVNRIIE